MKPEGRATDIKKDKPVQEPMPYVHIRQEAFDCIQQFKKLLKTLVGRKRAQ
jgi:hypothetical protein